MVEVLEALAELKQRGLPLSVFVFELWRCREVR